MENEKTFDIGTIISFVSQLPGIKVPREEFLKNQFKDQSSEKMQEILDKGPVFAGISRSKIKKKAIKVINNHTAFSAGASFLAGIPGGFAMAATIPGDVTQFYAVALRMAQELLYLYGEEDIWCASADDEGSVANQFILYFGVMLGATGASQAVRVLSSKLAQHLLRSLPRKALMKTIYYPIIKTILKYFGVSLTKGTFAKGVSKVVPVIGGIASGIITLASMKPMGNRLVNTLDKAHFDYTEEDFEEDMNVINEVLNKEESEENNNSESRASILEQLKEIKKMFDDGILTEDEYLSLKAKFISDLN